MTGDPRTTRRLLSAGGSVGLLSLAGCLGDDEGNGDADDADDAAADEGDDGADDHADDEGDDQDDGDDHDDDHEDLVADFAIVDRDTGEEVASIHDDHWHGDLPPIPLDDYVSLGGVFEDGDGEELPLGEGEEYRLNAELADGAQERIVEIETHGDHVDLYGEEEGRTDLIFALWYDDHADWESPPITAEVVESAEDHEADDGHDDHDHDDDY